MDNVDGTLLFLMGLVTGAGLIGFIAAWWIRSNKGE